MKLALLVPGFSADEADWCIPALRNIVQRLAREDDVRVFALRYPYRRESYELFGARVTAMGGATRRGGASAALWAGALSALASEHRRRPFDLLHVFWGGETGALGAVAGRVLGVPVVLSLAGGELAALKSIGYGGKLARAEAAKTRLALALAARITAGSSYLLSLAKEEAGSRASRLRLIPLGVDTELFRPDEEARRSDPPRLLQVASLVPVKDQPTLLRAASFLRDRGLDFRLEVVGSGPLEPRLRALSAELKLNGLVTFHGDLPHDRLPACYAGASVYVQSSLHEAQGMALLEAAACGVPAAGSRVGVLPEMEPEAAKGCETSSAEKLAHSVASVLGDGDRAAAMGEAARSLVENRYGLEGCIERFRSLYAEIT